MAEERKPKRLKPRKPNSGEPKGEPKQRGRPPKNQGNYTDSFYATEKCGALLEKLCKELGKTKGKIVCEALDDYAAKHNVAL